ncbi:MAG: phosphate ABC transporter substrate-binding protein PstS [Thiohalocapsa sp.]
MRKNRYCGRLTHGIALAALALGFCASASAAKSADDEPVKLVGAGASFPAPLYLRWFRDYYKQHPNVQVDYQSTGSAAGIRDLINGRIDFAGSDLRLRDDQQSQVPGGVRQVPMTAGAIVLAYNLEGVADLKLSRNALIGILTGRIARWNDPIIVADNPGTDMPDLPISVVVRGEGSGTTYHLTRHLSAVSPEFADMIGTTMSPNWPKALKQRGMLIKGKGNDGVAALVRAIPASIGYVQYAYSYLSGMSMAALENRSDQFVAPDQVSFAAALDAISADPDPNGIADPGGDASYPIIALSWLLLRDEYEDSAKQRALAEVIDYALGPGQAVSEQLGYIRFSSEARAYVRRLLGRDE